METLTDPEVTPKAWVPKHAGRTMSKADFLKWESDDVFVYEFNDGVLEPKVGLRGRELFLIRNLSRTFAKTQAYQQGGVFFPVECWLNTRKMRRPNAAFFSGEQLKTEAMGAAEIPTFVVELISEYDTIRTTETKLQAYFEAGVTVVWWVFPSLRRVYVYTSPKTVTIATDTDVISAAPALPDFTLTVDELFQV